MGALWQAITKNQHVIDSALDSLRQAMQRKREQEALNNFLNAQRRTTRDIQGIYDNDIVRGKNVGYETQDTPTPNTPTTKTQQLIGPTLPEKPEIPIEEPTYDVLGDYTSSSKQFDDANRKANSKILQLMNQSLGMQDVPPEKVNQGITLLQQLMQNQQPKKKDIGTFNPQYDVVDKETGEVIREGKQKQEKYDIEGKYENKNTGTYWTFDKQKGDYVDTGIPYDKKGTTVNVDTGTNDYNYSNLYSNVQEGIKEIDKIKEVSLEELEKDDKGNYKYFPPGKKEAIFFKDQNEFNQYKEQAKKKYANDAVQLMNERGLDGPEDRTPVKYIRAQMDKGYTYKEALDAFKKNNPDFSSKDVELMESYFELMTK